MGHVRSAAEVRQEYVKRLGCKLGTLFDDLRTEVAEFQVDWREFNEMFGTPERVDLINSAAGLFFRIVEDKLWEATLLHLTRLTDKVKVSGHETLTIRALPEAISDGPLRDEVTDLVEHAVGATEFARPWRNQRIAHHDRKLADPLPLTSRKLVSDAASAIHAVLNHISESLLGGSLSDHVLTPGTGARALLRVVQDGVKAREARNERFRTGRPLPEDLAPRVDP